MPDSNWRAEFCEACRDGIEVYANRPDIHVSSAGRVPCIAPSPDAHIADLSTRLQQSEAALGVMRTALEKYADCDSWSEVQSRTGDEDVDRVFSTYGNGCEIAIAALSTEAIAAEVDRRKATDAVVDAAREMMDAIQGPTGAAPGSCVNRLIDALEALDSK